MIAESHEYNADYATVTVRIREGVTWSDERPWSVHDLKFTWEGEDPTAFKNLDLALGLPVVSGSYRLARSDSQQRLWNLCADWWPIKPVFKTSESCSRSCP